MALDKLLKFKASSQIMFYLKERVLTFSILRLK